MQKKVRLLDGVRSSKYNKSKILSLAGKGDFNLDEFKSLKKEWKKWRGILGE